MRAHLTLLLILCSILLFGQENKIEFNQLNAKGKKHGYWKIHLDSSFRIQDSINSTFQYYNFYSDGEKYFRIFDKRGRDSIAYNKNSLLLNDTVWIYDGRKNKELVAYQVFSAGFPICYRTVYSSEFIDNNTFFDFEKKYLNKEASFYYETYQEKDTLYKGYIWFDGKKTNTALNSSIHKQGFYYSGIQLRAGYSYQNYSLINIGLSTKIIHGRPFKKQNFFSGSQNNIKFGIGTELPFGKDNPIGPYFRTSYTYKIYSVQASYIHYAIYDLQQPTLNLGVGLDFDYFNVNYSYNIPLTRNLFDSMNTYKFSVFLDLGSYNVYF